MTLLEKYKGATLKPWKVFGQNDAHDLSVDADDLCGCLTAQAVGPEGDEPVCMVVTKGWGPSADRRHDANARLIADAPMLACRVVELEDALKGMLQCFADDCEDLETVIKARQVLAANDNAPCGEDQSAGNGEGIVNA